MRCLNHARDHLTRRGRPLRAVLPAALLAFAIIAPLIASAFAAAVADDKAATPASKTPTFTAEQTAAGVDVFQKHVRLTLAHKCLKCHGGDHIEAKFDITTHEGLLRGSEDGSVVVLGDAKSSKLYKLVARQEEPYMPEEGESLTADELKHLETWLNLGAPYDKSLIEDQADKTPWTERTVAKGAEKFWSFAPLVRAEPPKVKSDEGKKEAWCRTDVDRFALAKLEEKGLHPNGIAERRVLIRRAYFDLIGLPPTPEEVEAFVKDDSPEAYRKVIDRLLESPHYGERWGRHWLDVARFAESHGFEQDYDRPFAYHFRDFVIEALNRDMPYDQFVRWQLAGDEIAPDDPLALKATGFLGAGVFPTQITANEVERTRYDALDDMAATTGTAFLGLTIGCARCHDHKFDPIPQADYYRFITTFTTTVRSDQEINVDPAGYQQAKEAFDREHAPLAEAQARFEREQLPARFAAWERNRPAAPQTWVVLDPVEVKSAGGATFVKQHDGSYLASGKNPASDVYTVVARVAQRPITGVRVEALADASLVKGGPGRASNGNFALSDFKVTIAPISGGNAVDVPLANPKASFEQPGLPIKATIDADPKSGWAVDPQFGKNHAAAYETTADVGFDGGSVLTFTLKFDTNTSHNIGRLRLAITSAARPHALDGGVSQEIMTLLNIPTDKRTAEQQSKLLAWYKPQDDEWRKLDAAVRSHLANAPKPKLVKMMICSEGVTPIRHHTQGADFFNESYFLKRGNCDQKEGLAKQGFLQILTRSPEGPAHWQRQPPAGWRTSYRRLALANWITDTDQGAGQLLARVMANRLWHHHFGRGIVATPSDFGKQGAAPTHPELLDYLATELIREGWRLKPLHRLIMTSAVYMQSTAQDAARAKIDPENFYLWRRTPRRLEAEIIRDAMLATSGALDRTQFGPGTLDEGQRRRSIYFMVKRSRLISLMQLFDQPEPLVSVGGRPTTTIAPQALAIMNNPHIRGYAMDFAKRWSLPEEQNKHDAAVRTAISQGYATAVGREPTAEETADAAAFIASQWESYRAAKKDNAAQLALADFCQVLFGLNEFAYIE